MTQSAYLERKGKRFEGLTKKLYLYDPRTNVSTEANYDQLTGMTGSTRQVLMSGKSRGAKLRSLGCYITDDETTVEERRALYEKEVFVGEIWSGLEGSEGEFLISNHGRFKRVFKTVEPKFLMPFMRSQNGHLYIKVRINGVYKQRKIAHMVARNFIGFNKHNLGVRHKNGIKTDCFAGNLQYISKSELGKSTGGTSGSKAVVQLCPKKMTPIEEYRSAREAGRKTFMSYQAVLDNCHNKTKLAAGSFKFMFLEDYESEGIA